MKIINLTQHPTTNSQRKQGVIDVLGANNLNALKEALTFKFKPNASDIIDKVKTIVDCAINTIYNYNLNNQEDDIYAMIDGAPFLMAPLEKALKIHGINPLYSYTEKITENVKTTNDNIVKVSKMEHVGFIESIIE